MTNPATVTDFANWTDRARSMTLGELCHSIRDCSAAAQAMDTHNPTAAGRYMDELATYRTELNAR